MKQLVPALFAVGALMALVGAAVFITGWIYAPYIYTIGAGFVALAQINTPVKGKSKTLKRLRIQQIFGAVALVLTGAFMFSTRGMDRLSYHRCHSGTLHGFSHSTRRSQAIIKVFSSFFYLPGSLLKFYSVLF